MAAAVERRRRALSRGASCPQIPLPQSLTEVASLTAAFRRYDPTGAGRATLDYGTFMHLVFATRS